MEQCNYNNRDRGTDMPNDFISTNPIPMNHQSATTLNFDYRLSDGKIYIRSRTPESPKVFINGDVLAVHDFECASKWQLLDGVGVPFDKDGRSLLLANEQVVAIDVANEIIVAVTTTDTKNPDSRVYLFKPTEKKRPTYWSSNLGAPDCISEDILILPSDLLSWTFSCSIAVNDDIRNTRFMNPQEIVDHGYDGANRLFRAGFCATIYVLNKNGQLISYWDTGLPPSFSRGFLVPEGTQGRFIVAAGSVVFLLALDSSGNWLFFTRKLDYEYNGATPGIKVTFENKYHALETDSHTTSDVFPLGYGERQMPLAGWNAHCVNEIRDCINGCIAIVVTGQGDDERELRIGGYDAITNEWGYYYKKITELDWQFHSDPSMEPINDSEIQFTPYDSKLPPLKYNYAGTLSCTSLFSHSCPALSKESLALISLELEGMSPWLSDSDPCYLKVTFKGRSERLRLYIVDAWNLAYNHRNDQDLIGSRDGEPKGLIGTIIFTDEQLIHASEKNSPLRIFLPFDRKSKKIPIIVNDEHAFLKFDSIKCCFSRSLTQEETKRSFYIQKAMDEALLRAPENYQECTSLIQENERCLQLLKTIYSHRRLKVKQNLLIDSNLSALQPIASLLCKGVLKPQDPTYQQAINDIKLLFKIHKSTQSYANCKDNKQPGFTTAKIILRARINALKLLTNQFVASNTEEALITNLSL